MPVLDLLLAWAGIFVGRDEKPPPKQKKLEWGAPGFGSWATRPALDLLLEHFFDLPDLFFDFAGPVFGFAFSL